MQFTKKIFFLIIMIILLIGSCISADEHEKEKKRLAAIKETSPELYSRVCYTIEQDGCEYIYCHWQPYSTSPKASIAITPKLNQKDPIKCNLGNARY